MSTLGNIKENIQQKADKKVKKNNREVFFLFFPCLSSFARKKLKN
jgi:hypothetical protein